MLKKWIIALVLTLLASTVIFIAYNIYNKPVQNPNENPAKMAPVIELTQSSTSTLAVITPEKRAILDAIKAKMILIMDTKNAKKIREFTLSLYQEQAERDTVKKLTDAQILKSAGLFKEFNMAESISLALTYLPESAWNISTSTATITQAIEEGHKMIFTATKVNGVWK